MEDKEKSTPASREKDQKKISDYIADKELKAKKKREDVNQAAFRVVRESTEG